jgi:sugar/nucleoside kinase (ribokinase family)
VKNLDFIAIGDTVVDAFIKLKDAKVTCDINEEHCTISMAFGDKIPYESVEVVYAVGNSANAAVAAARLGLNSGLISSLGNDDDGKKCLESLSKDGVSTEFMKIEDGKKTNYHYVLWYESDRTILVKHELFERHLPDIGDPKWLYLSSLGSDTVEYHKTIAEYVSKHLSVNLVFQPGTFQISLGRDVLKDIYKRTKIFFCNVQEAEKILGVNTLGTNELLKRMRELGPETVVITDGPKGAYAYDGAQMLFQPPYPEERPAYDRTGAGDAFASTCVSALALGNDLATALAWGSVNSMSVVQKTGAQKGLLTRAELEDFIARAPAEFTTRTL